MSDFWPQAGAKGSIIITSRNFSLAKSPSSAGEELQKLDQKESRDLAQSILQDWDSEDERECEAMSQLLQQVDGLPLAIHQLFSMINSQGSSLADFLDFYEEYTDEIYKESPKDHAPFYKHSLDTVWDFAIRTFCEDPQTRLLLGTLCLLSPDAIPEKLFDARKATALPPGSELYKSPFQ